MLLLYPPVTKTCEPPAGIAYLAASLRKNGFDCTVVDLNIECILSILDEDKEYKDTWSIRANKNRLAHLESLRQEATYKNISKYTRAVSDLNRILDLHGKEKNCQFTLANFQENEYPPTDSANLKHSYYHPERNLFFPRFAKRIDQLFVEKNHDIVGLSLNFLSQASTCFAIAGYIRSTYPSVKMILGGGLTTTWLRLPGWKNPFENEFDLMVAGSGECEILNLYGVKHSSQKYTPDYSDLRGNSYLAPDFILPYSTSTGCHWNKCAFCPEQAEKAPYVAIKQDTITTDTKKLVRLHNPKIIHFLDNSLSPATLKTLSKNPPGTNWYGFTRIHKLLSDLEFCKALKKSGCTMLKLGIESGSQRVLDAMSKGTDVSTVSQVLLTLKKAGISTYVYLLFGTPEEGEEEARQTLKFVDEHSDCITFLNLAIFNMPINSPDAAKYPSKNFTTGDLSLYRDFQHPKGWDRKKIRFFLDREFKQNRTIKAILANDPPYFTSNHAPFFCKS